MMRGTFGEGAEGTLARHRRSHRNCLLMFLFVPLQFNNILLPVFSQFQTFIFQFPRFNCFLSANVRFFLQLAGLLKFYILPNNTGLIRPISQTHNISIII